eukprot:UN13741
MMQNKRKIRTLFGGEFDLHTNKDVKMFLKVQNYMSFKSYLGTEALT